MSFCSDRFFSYCVRRGWLGRADQALMERWHLWCEKSQTEIIEVREWMGDDFVPVQPPLEYLFVRGEAKLLLSQHSLAVVGTRRPSEFGKRAGYRFSTQLAQAGWVIVSGLARGVDSCAHRGTILGGGRTVAVLGHGLDRVYPKENTALAEEIIGSGGALVSEYPPGVPPLRHHFPQRNRVISALAVATLVIEAGQKSGSLITARQAADQGRDVYVVPGPFDSESFSGSHDLIREGAQLVTKASQLIGKEVVADGATQSCCFSKRVRELFQQSKQALVLEELFLKCSLPLGELIEQLEQGIREGAIVECAPQKYLWLGVSKGRVAKPNSGTQNKNIVS